MTRFDFYILFVCLSLFGCQNPNAKNISHFERIEWDSTFVLNEGNGTFGAFYGRLDEQVVMIGGDLLPKSLAYATSITLPEGILCIGGRDSSQCYKDVFLITMRDGKLKVSDDWPSLPVPLSNAAGTVVDNKVYLFGGRESIKPSRLSDSFFVLDLSNKSKGWKRLFGYAGSIRENAILVVQNNGVSSCLYLLGGQTEVEEGKSACLTDGYVYDPQLDRWDSLGSDFPENICAGAACGANHVLLFQQDTSSLRHENIIWKYHTITHTLIKSDTIPYIRDIKQVWLENHSFVIVGTGSVSGDSRLCCVQGSIVSQRKGLGIINIIVIIGYFALLAGIGFYFSKRQKNTNDYFKGGGRIPWWAAGLSLFGTALSAITFMAIPSKAYATNWSYALFNTGIVLVAPVIVYVFIPFFRKLNITTAYEYLEIRFNVFVRVICSMAFIVFQIGRMGVVLFLPSIALNVVTGLDIFLCIGIMGICSILYTMIGGIEAVVWTDAIQVIILLGGAVFAVAYISFSLPGGLNETIDIAMTDGKFDLGSLDFDLKDATIWTMIIATCFTNLTTYGTDQSMVQRYLTTSSMKEARKSVWTNAVLTIPATLIFFFIGTALYAYYKTYPESLSISIPNGDAIFPWYIFTQLPVGVVGLLISGIFAAAMSTLSGSMNSAATAYIVDIYSRFFRKGKAGNGLRAARVATCAIGLVSLLFAFMMATWNIASLWDEFNKILGLVLGSMGGLFMLGMLTKRANSEGAIIGIVASIVVQLLVGKFQLCHLLLYTASGFISCFVIGYAASLFFNKR